MIDYRVLIILSSVVFRFGMNITFAEFVVQKCIVSFLMYDQLERKKEGDPVSSRSSIRDARARFAHAWLSVPSGTAGLLPTKWTIRNDTGGYHFSAKCRALSAGDDGSRLYIFSLHLSFLFSCNFFPLARSHCECFRRKSYGL